MIAKQECHPADLRMDTDARLRLCQHDESRASQERHPDDAKHLSGSIFKKKIIKILSVSLALLSFRRRPESSHNDFNWILNQVQDDKVVKQSIFPKTFIAIVFALIISIFPATSFASTASGSQLMVIEKLVNNISQELVALKGQNQQNWNKFFEQQISKQFTSSDYPVWHEMQSKMGEVRNTLGQTSLVGSARGDLYNPNLVNQASSVDTSSVKLASRVIRQIDNDSDSNLTSAVNIPLSSRWHQGLADANTIQVLKALSAQVAVSNAIQYKELQQSRNQQLLLARVLVELTQLNQNIVKLQGK